MLCSDWLQERKSRQKEEAEKRRIEEEENRPVGPMRPDTGIEAGAEGEYGGNLRPGEGERHASLRCVLFFTAQFTQLHTCCTMSHCEIMW